MALNIKNPETIRLVRELAQLRGQGLTETVDQVARREVKRLRRVEAKRKRLVRTVTE